MFLELPKLPTRRPETVGPALWAWLFVHAPQLTEMPADLSPGPYRDALELANKATFTQEELDAYQKVIDEIQQVRELAEACGRFALERRYPTRVDATRSPPLT